MLFPPGWDPLEPEEQEEERERERERVRKEDRRERRKERRERERERERERRRRGMARDWGFKLWILKVDIHKAFDTIKQTSVAAMVASKLQDTKSPMGNNYTSSQQHQQHSNPYAPGKQTASGKAAQTPQSYFPSKQVRSWKTRYARKVKPHWFKASQDRRMKEGNSWMTLTFGQPASRATKHDQRPRTQIGDQWAADTTRQNPVHRKPFR